MAVPIQINDKNRLGYDSALDDLYPQNAKELWELVDGKLPYLDKWKQRAKDLDVENDPLWLTAVYELATQCGMKRKFDERILNRNLSLEASDIRLKASIDKAIDATLKNISNIERRLKISEGEEMMDLNINAGENENRTLDKTNLRL